MSDETKPFECWAIIELFGHTKLAGRVTEQVIAGAGFLRIDVPRGDSFVTKLQSPKSVYGMTPCTEEIARAVAKTLYGVEPIVPVGAPALPSRDIDNESESGVPW